MRNPAGPSGWRLASGETRGEKRIVPLNHPAKHGRGLALVAAAALLGQLAALGAPFSGDDLHLYVKNPLTLKPGEALGYFGPRMWRRTHKDPTPYRPLREILLVTVRGAFGPTPTPLHAVSLAGHAANAMLVYVVAFLLLASPPGAAAAGLVFALHPCNVEAVAWAKNVAEVAAVFFALLGAMAWLQWLRASGPKRGRLLWAGSLAAFALSLLFKESAVSLPVILTAWVVLFRSGRGLRRGALGLLPFWALAVAYAAFQVHNLGAFETRPFVAWGEPDGTWPHFVVVLRTLFEYTRALVFPLWLNRWQDCSWMGGCGPAVQAGLCVGAAGLWALWVWAALRWRAGALAVFWTVCAMGPAANVLINRGRPLAEQRLYFPCVGFALALGAVAPLFSPWRPLRRWAAWVGLGLLLVYAVLLQDHLANWRSERRMWRRSARHAPPTMFVVRMRQGLGQVALGKLARALESFRLARLRRPTDYRGEMNVGMTLWKLGRREQAAAAMRRAVSMAPGRAKPRAELGLALMGLGRFSQALACLRKARELSPGDPVILCDIAETLSRLGRREQARGAWRRALEELRARSRKEPHSRLIHRQISRAAQALGLEEEAREAWDRAK